MKSSDRPNPLGDLLRRYWMILRVSWDARSELIGPKRLADEIAFLPAALSLQETAPHPAPRRFALILCLLFCIALVWAFIGETDIVAVAPGRVVVGDRSKTIQPLEASVVTRVLVKDGDVVKEGQVLIELDGTTAEADGANLQEQLAMARSEEHRTAALLRAMKSDYLMEGNSDSDFDAAQLRAEWQDHSAKLARHGAELTRRQAEIATVSREIAKLDATLPLAMEREADFQRLSREGFVSAHAGQDRTRERIELEQESATQRARLLEAKAALRESKNIQAAYLAETVRALNDRQVAARSQVVRLTQELSKTEQRARLTQLTSPVDGVVQQLAVHTVGGVVTPAQALMVIVPGKSDVTAEVAISNKDIGFVKAGQLAEIKLETFPFTRYGTVRAKVINVASDAVMDEHGVARFPAKLALQDTSIWVDGRPIRLGPGMNLAAEIKTGKITVMDYLLSPVLGSLGQSFRER